MKLTNGQIVGLLGSPVFRVDGALISLHGRSHIVEMGDKKVMETLPYHLGVGTRMAVAMMISTLGKPLEACHRVHQELVKAYTAKARAAHEPFAAGQPSYENCSRDVQELMDVEVEVGDLTKIKLVDLHVDENRIDPRHVVALMPVTDTTSR